MEENKSVQVKLWNRVVGYIALLDNGMPQFEYEKDFKLEGWEISPIELPLDTTLKFDQPHIGTSFYRLPGIIADCLPDRFGMRVIRDYYKTKYDMEDQEINVIRRLLYVGSRATGALEFEPHSIEDDPDISDQLLELKQLTKEAKKTLEGKANLVTSQIMRIGGSAGGARAKALIDYDPKSNQIRSGFSDFKKGFVPCIVKFDGVKDGEAENVYGRLEYVYSCLARSCNINMPQTYLLEDDGLAHFIVERFDRNSKKEKPFHYASLCGLLTRDYIQKHSCTYEELFQLTAHLTRDVSQVIEMFKLAVFNIVFRNQDDHTKNFGFLMDDQGVWKVSPAFDLNYVYGFGTSQTHQMKLNGKDDDFEIADLMKVGKAQGIKDSQTKKIIQATLQTAKGFVDLAISHGLEREFAEGIHSRFRTFNQSF